MSQAHVMFRAGGQSFAIASSIVHAIHDELALQAVGDTQKWFLGLAVADGVLIPVTDFGSYLELPPASGRTLSLSPDVGVGALRVDEVMGVDDTATKASNAALPLELQANAPLFTYSLNTSTGEHWVLDVPRLLQSKRFVDIGVSA
ncbi:MAG: chemotaxis protein CheW [Granulosicoccaceae bacterium]